jgi:hypothetical protein
VADRQTIGPQRLDINRGTDVGYPGFIHPITRVMERDPQNPVVT